MELLAPAGSPESLKAAVQSGADAVYLGFGSFNARRNAKNFSEEEFVAAVSYCHLYGVKVYLTLNTLLFDRELPLAAEVAKAASDAGVDAILVQDWGVLRMLQNVIPDVPLHASTQMSLFSLSGVQEAAKLGMTRAVLAREMSQDEIRAISQASPIEIEVFGHGALCMCYSGQCEFSAVLGGRSGNRGTCAQPCRLPYGVDTPAKQYPLSLKDSCLADELASLESAGVSCIKLEGRMKRPEYVSVITRIYAALLREHRTPSQEEYRELLAAFSRNGFTKDYYLANKGPAMFGTRPENARDPEDLFSEARKLYENDHYRKIPVSFTFTLAQNTPCSLTVSDADGHRLTVQGPIPEIAAHRPLTEEAVAERLSKTGNTPYRVDSLSLSVEDGLILSAAQLNQLRRSALEQLSALRTVLPARTVGTFLPSADAQDCSAETPSLTCSLSDKGQLTKELLSLSPSILYFPLEWMKDGFKLPPFSGTYAAVLPRVYRDKDLPLFRDWLDKAGEQGVSDVLIGNIGLFSLVKGFHIHGDFGLNITNSESLFFLRDQGLTSATLSFELRHEQIRDLKKPLPVESIVYGRLPLMITENCLIHNNVGCSCEKPHVLNDRKNASFPLLPAYGCRTEIQNSATLFLADKPEWKTIGLRFARLRFTTESPTECVRIFRRYLEETAWPPESYTRGLFYRGVE